MIVWANVHHWPFLCSEQSGCTTLLHAATRFVNDVTFPHKFQPIEIISLVFFQLFLIGTGVCFTVFVTISLM